MSKQIIEKSLLKLGKLLNKLEHHYKDHGWALREVTGNVEYYSEEKEHLRQLLNENVKEEANFLDAITICRNHLQRLITNNFKAKVKKISKH